MSIVRKVGIDGKEVLFKASAAIPRIYRLKFQRDIYTMAKHADPAIPDDVEEWLDGFNTFSIYQVLPELIKLWGLNVKTDAEAKKNFGQQSGR